MKHKIAYYTFAPWRMRDGKYVVASEATWRMPARWNAATTCVCSGNYDGGHQHHCPKANHPRVLLTCDPFEDWQGPMVASNGIPLSKIDARPWTIRCSDDEPTVTMADVRARLFALIDATPNLDWIVPTKRPENIARMMPKPAFDHAGWNGTLDGYWHQMDKPRPNLWLGVSVESQQAADERIPHLLRVPAAVRFLSCEPLLGPVDLAKLWMKDRSGYWNCLTGKLTARVKLYAGGEAWVETEDAITGRIGWVIVGGESGPGARPMHPDSARSLRDQCQAAGVPFYFEGWGEWADYFHVRDELKLEVPKSARSWGTLSRSGQCEIGLLTVEHMDKGYRPILRVGKKAAGRLLDGREWDELPAVEAAS